MAATEAKFSIPFESNAGEVAGAAADDLERLRDTIRTSEDSVKSMSASLRRLRGSSDEVKNAKAELRARIDASRNAIVASELALIKQGTSYDKLAAKAKASGAVVERAALAGAEGTTGFGGALERIGGPAGRAAGALRGLADRAKEITSDGAAAGAVLGGLALALGVVAGMAVAAATKLARFAIVTGDQIKQESLLREAWTGSAANAKALGSQIDLLGTKVSTSREKLNELAVGLAKNGVQGQALVDTLNAVGRASDALGEDAGSKLRELVERGRLTQRFAVNPLELQGTGLAFDDLAQEIARSMRVGIGDARAALAEGRVRLADGAEAMRRAVEKKFGAINAKKLLTIDGLTNRLKKSLVGLVSGVNLEPLAKGVDKLDSLFDEGSVTGFALKKLVTGLGDGAASSLGGALPIAKAFFQGLILGAIQLDIAILRLRLAAKKAFGSDAFKGLDGVAITLGLVRGAVGGVVLAIEVLGRGLIGSAILLDRIGQAWRVVGDAIVAAATTVKGLAFAALGGDVVSGFVDGIKAKIGLVTEAVTGLGSAAKQALKSALGIASPSKVFAQYGEHTGEGYARGVEASAPDAQKAVDRMAPLAPAGGGGGRGGVTIAVNVTVNAGGKDGAAIAATLNSPAVLAPLVKALEEALLGAGVVPGGARA